MGQADIVALVEEMAAGVLFAKGAYTSMSAALVDIQANNLAQAWLAGGYSVLYGGQVTLGGNQLRGGEYMVATLVSALLGVEAARKPIVAMKVAEVVEAFMTMPDGMNALAALRAAMAPLGQLAKDLLRNGAYFAVDIGIRTGQRVDWDTLTKREFVAQGFLSIIDPFKGNDFRENGRPHRLRFASRLDLRAEFQIRGQEVQTVRFDVGQGAWCYLCAFIQYAHMLALDGLDLDQSIRDILYESPETEADLQHPQILFDHILSVYGTYPIVSPTELFMYFDHKADKLSTYDEKLTQLKYCKD